MKKRNQFSYYFYDHKVILYKVTFSAAIVFLVYSILFGITW